MAEPRITYQKLDSIHLDVYDDTVKEVGKVVISEQRGWALVCFLFMKRWAGKGRPVRWKKRIAFNRYRRTPEGSWRRHNYLAMSIEDFQTASEAIQKFIEADVDDPTG